MSPAPEAATAVAAEASGYVAVVLADATAAADRLNGAAVATAVEQGGKASTQEADRLAAFAMGCLGVQTVHAVGKKLGLMGNATPQELENVLLYIEQLHLRYVAKLANGSAVAMAAAEASFQRTRMSSRFESELLAAVQAQSVAELFDRLPHDWQGQADLCSVFECCNNIAATTLRNAARQEGELDFTCDYFEKPTDLPQPVSDSALREAKRLLLLDPDEETWEVEASAVNAMRAALVKGSCFAEDADLSNHTSLVRSISRRCTSRRPALAKAALHVIGEMADSSGSSSCDQSVSSESTAAPADTSGAWMGGGASQEVISACLSAMKGTKMVARVAEQSLAAIVKRMLVDTSAATVARAVAACTSVAVGAKPAQPAVVAGGLRALQSLAPDVAAARVEVSQLCEAVLATKGLSASFATARAVQRTLPA